MPQRPPRHRAVPQTTLPAHTVPRASAAARGYDRDWTRLARWFRRQHPLCADPFRFHAADGVVVPGTEVDHIVPRSAGGTDDPTNLQTLCVRCHSRKTALCDGGFGNRRTAGGVAGRKATQVGDERGRPFTRVFEGFAIGGVAPGKEG